MKSEIYNALASLNRGFDVILESLKILQEEGVITAEYASEQNVLIQEMWSGINHMVVNKLHDRERGDRQHFSRMRQQIEERRKGGRQII